MIAAEAPPEGQTVARASTLSQPALRGDVVLVLYAVGWLLVVLALAMLVPAAVDAAQGEPEWRAFTGSAAITLFFGTLLVLSCQGPHREPRVRTAFLLTSLTWLAVALFGSLPFQIGEANLSFTDAVFETVSGITTTGSTGRRPGCCCGAPCCSCWAASGSS